MKHSILLALILPAVVQAQTYVVTSATANFMDGEVVVSSIPRGAEIYVWDRQDSWLHAVEPKSLKRAWISERDVRPRKLPANAAGRLKKLREQEPEIVKIVNRTAASSEDHVMAKARAQELRDILGDAHPDSVRALQHAGLIAQNARFYAVARTMLTKAVRTAQRVHGGDSERTAEIHLDLAYVLADMSMLADAARQAKAAAIIRAKIYGNSHPQTMECFVPLAIAMDSISDHESAFKYYDQVRSSYEAGYGADDIRTLKISGRLADVTVRLGNAAAALDRYESVLKSLKRQPNKDDRWIARTELKIDLLRLTVDDPDQLTRFLDRTKQFKSEFPWDIAFAEEQERQLVQSLLRNQRPDDAFQILDTVLRRLRQQLRVELWGLDNQTRMNYLSFADGGRFFEAVAWAVRHGDKPNVVKMCGEWLINGKGLVREVQAVTQGFQDAPDRRREWTSHPWISVRDLQSSLPENAIFVDLLKCAIPRSGVETATAEPEYIACVTPSAGPQQLIRLGDAAKIEAGIAELRHQIQSSGKQILTDGEDAAYARMSGALKQLSQLLWHPITDACGPASHIIVAPDGPTWLVPWGALLDKSGRFAIEDYQIQLQVSGRQLVGNRMPAPRSPPAIFANPEFGDPNTANRNPNRAGGTVQQIQPVSPLENTINEAAAAKLALQELTGRNPQILLGSEASEARFKSLNKPSLLLLSTHGFFLQADSPGSPADIMLRCGLLLSNANSHSDYRALRNDGVLTGAEVMSADLRGTKLAVLSACETGIGEIAQVEGISDLRSAFHLAGAECVIATLWSVHDKQTSYLVAGLFESLGHSESAAEALRKAQLERIRSHRKRFGAAHPFYWAAFTASGNTSADSF